jgi:putative DNA primase/helicase
VTNPNPLVLDYGGQPPGKPTALPLEPANIPLEMKERAQFVCWRSEFHNERWTKVPYQPNGQKAKVNDPSTWHTWTTCLGAYQDEFGSFDGVMFALSADDPYTFIDLDHCADPLDGFIEPWANEICGQFTSYTEKSPSNSGIHILIKAKLPAGGHNNQEKGLEIYDQGRFVTMTGHSIGDVPINARQGETNTLVKEHWPQDFAPAAPLKKHPIDVNQSHQFTDDDIIGLMAKAANGTKVMALWEGEFADYASQSEADLALCNHIAFYSQDAGQIDSLFRQSALYRPKWDEKHGSQAYGEITIATALANVGDTYKGKPRAITKTVSTVVDGNESQPPVTIIPAAHQKPFKPALVAQAIKDMGYRFAMGDGRLYMYQSGVYIPANGPLQTLLIGVFGDDWQPRQVEAVQTFLEHDSPGLWDTPPADRINMKNGIFNLKTGELEDQSPDFLSSIQLNINHDAGAECPRIQQFISGIVEEDAQVTIYQMVGYLCTADNTAQKAFLLVGGGANGKGTLLRVITKMLGKQNVSAIPLQKLTTDRFAKAGLYGKLANIAGDISSERLTETSEFKGLVGGDMQMGEHKYGHAFAFTPFARHVFSINEIFESSDTGYAFRRRWTVIPFPHTFPVKDMDSRLQTPGEMAGFFNLALDAWRNAGGQFTIGDAITKAGEQFHEAIDPVVSFLKEKTVTGAVEEYHVKKPDLYQAYRQWCEANGRRPLSARKFNERVAQTGAIIKILHGVDTWYGIGLVKP